MFIFLVFPHKIPLRLSKIILYYAKLIININMRLNESIQNSSDKKVNECCIANDLFTEAWCIFRVTRSGVNQCVTNWWMSHTSCIVFDSLTQHFINEFQQGQASELRADLLTLQSELVNDRLKVKDNKSKDVWIEIMNLVRSVDFTDIANQKVSQLFQK